MLGNNLCIAIRIWQPSNNSKIKVTSSSTKPIKQLITIRELIQQQVEEESKQLIITLTHCTSPINRMLEVNSQMEEDQWVVLAMTRLKTDMGLFKTTASLVMLKTWTRVTIAPIQTQLLLASIIQRIAALLIRTILWMKLKADSCKIYKTTDPPR